MELLNENCIIDTKIQKGFSPGVSGVTDHLELMQYLQNNQKISILLLDLKNSFGEVGLHHSLTRFDLEQLPYPA